MALETKKLTELYYEFINRSKEETPFSKFMNFLGFLLATSFVIVVVLFFYSAGVEELNEKYERWGENIWLDYFLAIGSYSLAPLASIFAYIVYFDVNKYFGIFLKETELEESLKNILQHIHVIEERDHKNKRDSSEKIPYEIKNDFDFALRKRSAMYTINHNKIREFENKYKFSKRG